MTWEEIRKARGLEPEGPEPSAGDLVNHPAHYTHGGIEVIDAIEAWQLNYHLGNAVKYIARADHKGASLQDLKKAQWYLAREIARREKGSMSEVTSFWIAVAAFLIGIIFGVLLFASGSKDWVVVTKNADGRLYGTYQKTMYRLEEVK